MLVQLSEKVGILSAFLLKQIIILMQLVYGVCVGGARQSQRCSKEVSRGRKKEHADEMALGGALANRHWRRHRARANTGITTIISL